MKPESRRAMFAKNKKKIRSFDKRHGIHHISSKELIKDVERSEIKAGKSPKRAKYIAGAEAGIQYRNKLALIKKEGR